MIDGVLILSQKRLFVETEILKMSLSFFLILGHALYALPLRSVWFFWVLAFSVGGVAEFLGMNFDTIFGGQYLYQERLFGPEIGGVPLMIPIFWSVFVYSGYALTNVLITIHKKIKIWHLVLFDIWNVVAIDLMMDPLFVKIGKWVWYQEGSYFGVPLGNFLGWGIVVFLVSLIFRSYEYFFMKKQIKEEENAFVLIPVWAYLILYLSFVFLALYLKWFSVVLVGGLVMLPVPLGILYFYWKLKK